MEDPGRRRSSSKAARRLQRLLALAGEYIRYLFMNRRRLLGRAARRTLAVLGKHQLAPLPPPALMEHEFSFSDDSLRRRPAPFLQSRLKRGSAVAGAVVSSSCFGSLRGSQYGGSPATEKMEEEEVDVDCRAEEFINMFYEQLRAQSFSSHCSP